MTVSDLLDELVHCDPADELLAELVGTSGVRLVADGTIVAQFDAQ